MTDYWTGEFKTAELTKLRAAAERHPSHRAYIDALAAHYDAGGDESDDNAPEVAHSVRYSIACEIADAVGDIYRAVRGEDRNSPIDRKYLRRQVANARRRAASHPSGGALTGLLDLDPKGNPHAAE